MSFFKFEKRKELSLSFEVDNKPLIFQNIEGTQEEILQQRKGSKVTTVLQKE